MSLSSLLLANGPKKIDAELDALFKSNLAPPRSTPVVIQAPAPGSAPPTKKRKIEATIPDPPERKKKRGQSEKHANSPKSSSKIAKQAVKPKSTKSAKHSEPVVDEDSDKESADDEDNSDLENAYLGKMRSDKPGAPAEVSEEEEIEADDSGDSDSDDPDAPPPVHESLTKRVRTKPAKKAKTVPENETPIQRNARTLFIGELPLEVAQKKPLKKQLSRHILTFIPSSSKVKIESMRFRSVAFRDPTSSTAMTSSTSTANANSTPILEGSNHSKARASTWRAGGGQDDKSQAKADGDLKKEYLTPAQKKKIMFIQGAFHPQATTVTAYVVLAHPAGDSDNDNDIDSPYSVALQVARAANASEFIGRSLRVDVCARLPDAGEADGTGTGPSGDPKLSIFLGNLDFSSSESDVREFFEGVVAGERGPAPSTSSEDGTSVGRWVQSVRLIRDRETQLGKGFGYVHFVDRECVDEILALAKTEEGKKKLKFAKRTLRVQRCRAVNSTSKPDLAKSTPAAAAKSKSTYPATPPKRGDPTLGARLVHLDKDARKAAKKADPDRLLRRAEKKKLGMRMRAGRSNDKIEAVSGGKRMGGTSKDKGGRGRGRLGSGSARRGLTKVRRVPREENRLCFAHTSASIRILL
ncbi:RRM domain-containing protein [Mycena sanguinolenta]|uniref:Nucleolar protein 12 n=1 Tax=Mycena sanguinolenta TaxID=230812 RepID=A0A8H7CUG1_9AGAR|nr:RRM domain-containing protein [Mycena sanguinolenta]